MEDFVNDELRAVGRGVEDLLDEILPESLEWERLVRAYPVPALAVAAAGGFYLGLRHGTAILAAVSSYMAAEISRNVGEILGQG
ncbi:MAG TPA: hypothetical protein VH394_13480 [Thermoanaerobaculia bacterium]|jgi:hypothetical protein|nr:hypothetical protein [Thermoanaerobaculia bacterium]